MVLEASASIMGILAWARMAGENPMCGGDKLDLDRYDGYGKFQLGLFSLVEN
jgi:hypothetical protein